MVAPLALGALALAPTVARGIFDLFDSSEEDHQKTMEEVAREYQAYRPEMQANRYSAMQNQAAAFGPMQQLMGQMYGPGAQMDFSKIVQNPFRQPPPQAQQPSSGQAAFNAKNLPQGQTPQASNFDYRGYQDF